MVHTYVYLTVADLINAPLKQMRHLDLKCNFHALFKCAHPRVPILYIQNLHATLNCHEE